MSSSSVDDIVRWGCRPRLLPRPRRNNGGAASARRGGRGEGGQPRYTLTFAFPGEAEMRGVCACA